MKPTIGTVSMNGVVPVSKSLDSVGAMARSPADLAVVMEMLQATGPSHDENLSQLMVRKWDGLRIGFVDEKIWELPEALCKHDDEALSQMVNALILDITLPNIATEKRVSLRNEDFI